MNCPLCDSSSIPFFEGPLGEYERCINCMGVFLLPQYHLNKEDEKARYEKHNNNVEDTRYQNFVQPLVDAVISSFSIESKGLDFGCGMGPVISYLLNRRGFDIDLFDPYFHRDDSVFNKRYDLVILSEVMEHFSQPGKEFDIIFSLLNPGGKIFCLTEVLPDDIEFKNWHYKNDETHVFFYHQRSIEYISKKYSKNDPCIDGRLIIFG